MGLIGCLEMSVRNYRYSLCKGCLEMSVRNYRYSLCKGCLEMSVRNYRYSLCNNLEENSSHLLCGGNLKSHMKLFQVLVCICNARDCLCILRAIVRHCMIFSVAQGCHDFPVITHCSIWLPSAFAHMGAVTLVPYFFF